MEDGKSSKSIIKFKSGAPPLEVHNNLREYIVVNGLLMVLRTITYKFGKRVFYLKISSEVDRDGHVNTVDLKLCELIGKGSSAVLNMQFIKNNIHGVLISNINSKFKGSYDSSKDSYRGSPHMPVDTEVIEYCCRESGLGGSFTLAKKEDKVGVVEKVKATHSFDIDGELSYTVSIKITHKPGSRGGLSVEVEGPMKLTKDYTDYQISTIKKKMEASTRGLIEESKHTRVSINTEVKSHVEDAIRKEEFVIWKGELVPK